MSTTDTTEKGLETLIVEALTRKSDTPQQPPPSVHYKPSIYGSLPYVEGSPKDFDRDHAVDLVKLLAFLQETQPKVVEQLGIGNDSPKRDQFLARLQGQITKRGIIDVLRKGVQDGPATITLFYGTPTPGNTRAEELWLKNIFSVTRQLQYSRDETRLALDLCLFINGLPIVTFELKNRLTKQTYDDAIQQYKRDRDPRELIFQFKRCMVHFAVDDQQVWMCTQLKGNESWFLPFNKGYHDGAGNPPNPAGIKTDYLWKEILTRDGLTDIIENYAQVVEEIDRKTGKKKQKQIFPRFHQLDLVHKLLNETRIQRIGKRFLIQHSAGSGKSNSIAWLAHQLIGLQKNDKTVFDSIIVVTDRKVLDKQIRDTVKQFAQVSSTVGAVTEGSPQLREFIQSGKKIIITTVQKFPFILDEIGNEHRNHKFAIIIDEAHSSQGGRTSAKMNIALSETGDEEEETVEDKINHIIEARKMLKNADYFAFTATPKNKTLEIFGEPYPEGDVVHHRPFHSYTMKQAIDEGFILDVLKNYTPVYSYYRLTKTIEDDPEFDTRRAIKKLRKFVESNETAIEKKAEIMIDHFNDHVYRTKIGGEARAMVVTSGIERAIQYYHAFNSYLTQEKRPYKPIVAFSGEYEYKGIKVTEVSLNGFPSKDIEDKFQEDPYRFLIVAEKFQTGYDEPLLHTMYVDKPLSGIKAVQTLSRINRAHPKKHDTFVLDFMNNSDVIRFAFEDYYRTTILSDETDPNKLHDLKADIDGYQIYSQEEITQLVDLYLKGASREKLDPVLDTCTGRYIDELDEDGQVDFKGNAKAFVRTYNFLGSILPYTNPEWEKLSIFLNFLIPKLPAPKEEDLSKGILEAIDMDSYRVEVKSALAIRLSDQNGTVGPVPTRGGGRLPEPDLDRLSNIIRSFNELWGKIDWKDKDKIQKVITEEIPAKVAADRAYQNAMKHSDKQNARIEHDTALNKVLVELLADQTELFKLYSDNLYFRKWLADMVFKRTYSTSQASANK
ncbi:MAG: type I restriction endonuclease subunit R [Methanoregula sp.]|uniref:type I restriction endonuclease subunit R n=1 Tax=Methanoregula sp. TaxID=2052170 RepID=UPI003C16B9C2